jgi:AraC-like DNA-binding protein
MRHVARMESLSHSCRSHGSAPPSMAAPILCSLADVPERERHTRVRDFFEGVGVLYDFERLDDVPLAAELTLQGLPGLMLVSGQMHGTRKRRTRDDAASLLVNVTGSCLISQGGREIALDEGDATFVSMEDPVGFTHKPPGGHLALRFPRAQIASLVTGAEDRCLRRIPRETYELNLLRGYIEIAWQRHTMASAELQHLFVSHTYDLAALAIGTTRDAAHAASDRGVRAAQLCAIKADIARSLGEADLSLATLAARHGLTHRHVQRMFEAEGTSFTDYVLAQRLARAHRLLSDPRRAAEKIATVAYDAGFGDVSYFNRAFRRRYGVAPSEVRWSARRLDG